MGPARWHWGPLFRLDQNQNLTERAQQPSDHQPNAQRTRKRDYKVLSKQTANGLSLPWRGELYLSPLLKPLDNGRRCDLGHLAVSFAEAWIVITTQEIGHLQFLTMKLARVMCAVRAPAPPQQKTGKRNNADAARG